MAHCSADSSSSRAPAFFGDAEHVRQFGAFLVTQNRYSPNVRLQSHAHERAFISFVVRGSYIEYCDRRPIRCAPGTLIFHPSGEEHSDSFESQEAVLLGIELDDPTDSDQKLFSSRHVMTGPETFIAGQLARELNRQCPVSNLVVESLAAEIVSNCCHGTGRKGTPRWLGTAVEIANDLYASRISLKAVAAAAGVHPIHLARQFRSRMGCTFGEFVRRIRLARALEQLRHTSASIAEIAAASGFADQSHLTRLMTAMIGQSPAAYRRESHLKLRRAYGPT
jgi:AraC family transcriptional regulator